MTRAIRIHATGGPEVLRLEELTLGHPGAGEVRIRHTAIGLNFTDVYTRTGLYKAELPSGLGSEAAGVVEEVGTAVGDLAPGDRVAYATGPLGAYATERIVPASKLVRLPSAISDDVAAASLLKGMTVEYLVCRTFPVKSGQTVLFHAAAGGVGLIACQWLKAIGATVIGTVSSDEKAEIARAHGCDHPIVTAREDFPARVRELTGGKGCAVVYDSIGKDTLERSLDCVSPRGLCVSFGNASGKPAPVDPLVLMQKGSLFLTRTTLAHYVSTPEELKASADALFARIASGQIKVDVRQRWPLAEAAEAHRALEARKTTGSTLLIP